MVFSTQEEIHLNCQCNLPKHKISTITILSKNYTDIRVLSSHLLFDKSSWASVVSEPYKTYLDQAADRWGLYMSYNSSVVTTIRGLDGFSTWNGLALDPLKYTLYGGEPGIIASSGPWIMWIYNLLVLGYNLIVLLFN